MIATDPLSTEDFSQGVVNRREGDFLEAFKKLDDEIKGDPKQDLSKEPDVDALVEESNDFKPPMPAMVLTTNAGDYVPLVAPWVCRWRLLGLLCSSLWSE